MIVLDSGRFCGCWRGTDWQAPSDWLMLNKVINSLMQKKVIKRSVIKQI